MIGDTAALNSDADRAPRFDQEITLEPVEGDVELPGEIVALCLEEATDLLRQVCESVRQRDATRIEHSAHSLKGSVANFGADACRDAAFRLEVMGRNRELDQTEATYTTLEAEMIGLQQELGAWQSEKAAFDNS